MMGMKQSGPRRRSRLVNGGYLFVGIVLGAILGLGGLWLALYSAGMNVTNQSFQKFFSVYEILATKYYRQLPQTTLLNGAVSGMVQSVGDPFTDYFTPQDAAQFQSMLSGSMVGIGVELVQQRKNFLIQAVVPNSPAESAGLMAGDLIDEIDGKPVTQLDFNHVRQMIIGPKGTTVTLTVSHANSTSVKTVIQVKRAAISVPTVYFKMLNHRVGYIEISIFGATTGNEVKKAYNTLNREGVKAWVVDLRNNPGGYLDQAISVASVFVPTGRKLLSTVDRNGETSVYNSSGPGTHLPLVVLMNGDTASAAEVLASAFHDDLRAPLVGEKSFGKGTVQETQIYQDGSGLKYTVAKWLTASGQWIHHIGIKPTDVVPIQSVGSIGHLDAQLGRAVQLAVAAEKS